MAGLHVLFTGRSHLARKRQLVTKPTQPSSPNKPLTPKQHTDHNDNFEYLPSAAIPTPARASLPSTTVDINTHVDKASPKHPKPMRKKTKYPPEHYEQMISTTPPADSTNPVKPVRKKTWHLPEFYEPVISSTPSNAAPEGIKPMDPIGASVTSPTQADEQATKTGQSSGAAPVNDDHANQVGMHAGFTTELQDDDIQQGDFTVGDYDLGMTWATTLSKTVSARTIRTTDRFEDALRPRY